MADEDTTEEEPSIEEILDSIRQIISDDDEEGGEEESAAVEEGPESEPESDPEPEAEEEPPIELTDAVEEEPEPEPEPEPEDVKIDMREVEEEAEPEPEPEPVTDDSILTDTAEIATYDGFEKLVRSTAVERNGITLEEIVRTEIRPLLRQWLDDQLPEMIERLVQEELARISKRVLDD